MSFFWKVWLRQLVRQWKRQRLFKDLFERDKTRIEVSGRSTPGVLKIHDCLKRFPVSNTTGIKEFCGVSLPTVLRCLLSLEFLGIVKEITGKDRRKIFVYEEYLDILNRGTEPIF